MRRIPIIVFACVVLSPLGHAQIDLSGYGAVGFQWYNRPAVRGYNNATYYEGKLQVESELTDRVSAQWDFRGYSDNGTVELREFSVALKYWKPVKVKIGNLRLPFGVEQMIEREEMDMVTRSYIHDRITEMGYAGRSVSIVLQRNQRDEGKNAFPFSYYVMVYKNNGLSYGTVIRAERAIDDLTFGGSIAVQRYDENCRAVAASMNVGYTTSAWSGVTEVFVLEDPIEEKARKEMTGILSTVLSFGARVHTTVSIPVEWMNIERIEPFYEGGFFLPDNDVVTTHVFQNIIGANFYFEPQVRFRVQGNLLARRTRYNPSYSFYNSTVTVELQVRL